MTSAIMPNPFSDGTGSGLHMHLSLWKDDNPLFPAEQQDDHGLGLSQLAYLFIAGLLEHAVALQSLRSKLPVPREVGVLRTRA